MTSNSHSHLEHGEGSFEGPGCRHLYAIVPCSSLHPTTIATEIVGPPQEKLRSNEAVNLELMVSVASVALGVI